MLLPSHILNSTGLTFHEALPVAHLRKDLQKVYSMRDSLPCSQELSSASSIQPILDSPLLFKIQFNISPSILKSS
jgi:hypothetical protein